MKATDKEMQEVERLLRKTSFEEVQEAIREYRRKAHLKAIEDCGWTEGEWVAELHDREAKEQSELFGKALALNPLLPTRPPKHGTSGS